MTDHDRFRFLPLGLIRETLFYLLCKWTSAQNLLKRKHRNDFLIWHLRPVKSNFDEIKPCSCVLTTYTYDSFIWLKVCEIEWHILFFCSRKQNVEKCVKQKETYIHCFNIRHCLVPSSGCERRRVVCRASDFATWKISCYRYLIAFVLASTKRTDQ